MCSCVIQVGVNPCICAWFALFWKISLGVPLGAFLSQIFFTNTLTFLSQKLFCVPCWYMCRPAVILNNIIKNVYGSLFSKSRYMYMNGVGFKMSGRTSVPKL